jgi:predicted Zn-dependent protease
VIARAVACAIAAFMALCAYVVSRAPMDGPVSPSSALALWADLNSPQISITSEIDLGRRMAASLPAAPPDAYLSSVGSAVAAHAPRPLSYQFLLLRGGGVQPFALPGGAVYLPESLYEQLESESELAFVLAHEIAHASLQHSIGRYQSLLQSQNLAIPDSRQLAALTRSFASASYTASQQSSADLVAIDLLPQAGYDPQAAIAFLTRNGETARAATLGIWIDQNLPVLKDRVFCRGRWNLANRSACTLPMLPIEAIRY